MPKNNIRSIRFSDEIREAIESQTGENFNQKFEALVTRCLWELPAAEERLRQVNQQISDKKKELRKLSLLARDLEADLHDIRKAVINIAGNLNDVM